MKVKRNNYNLNYPIKSRKRKKEREKERDGCYKNIRDDKNDNVMQRFITCTRVERKNGISENNLLSEESFEFSSITPYIFTN